MTEIRALGQLHSMTIKRFGLQRSVHQVAMIAAQLEVGLFILQEFTGIPNGPATPRTIKQVGWPSKFSETKIDLRAEF